MINRTEEVLDLKEKIRDYRTMKWYEPFVSALKPCIVDIRMEIARSSEHVAILNIREFANITGMSNMTDYDLYRGFVYAAWIEGMGFDMKISECGNHCFIFRRYMVDEVLPIPLIIDKDEFDSNEDEFDSNNINKHNYQVLII